MPARAVTDLTPDQYQTALDAAERIFPPGNPYGVFAFAIEHKRTGGRRSRRMTLVVYVARKELSPRVPIPEIEVSAAGGALRLKPDVVSVGSAARASQGSGDPYFTGLHPGSALLITSNFRRAGGVACLLGGSDSDLPSHLLTAGHLFYPEDLTDEIAVLAADPGAEAPVEIGVLKHNLLDLQPDGLPFAVDAALVELNASGREMAVRSAERGPRLNAVVPFNDVFGLRLQAFKPTASDYSEVVQVAAGPTTVHLEDEIRETFTVKGVARTRGAITAKQDSGTIACTIERARRGLGSCVGADGAGSIFEPDRPSVCRPSSFVNSIR